MRNIHGHYGRWFNKEFEREGRFWADRFKSVILESDEAIMNCIQYIDLNPIRAEIEGISRPEEWKFGSYKLRDMKLDEWLMPMQELMNLENEKEAYQRYRERLYYMGGIQTKEDTGVIPAHILAEEEKSGFVSKNILLKRTKHYTRGLVLGGEKVIQKWLQELTNRGIYKRRCNPIMIADSCLNSLR